MRFPTLATRTLTGVDKHLPAHLPADRTLLALAFQQRHQRDVDAWMAVAERHGWATDLAEPQPTRPTYASIEVPCISRRWGPARRFIDGGMTSGIRVPTILARTWTAYTDVGRVQRALGIANSESIWVAVLVADGEVLAETLGTPTDDSTAIIAGAMDGGIEQP
jgi:hypothetical protein